MRGVCVWSLAVLLAVPAYAREAPTGNWRAEVIVSWNSLAHDVAVAEDQFLTFKGQRALAMMHLAMHDALNAIVPVYEPYAYRAHPRLAHPIAATAQAAHDVMAALYPTQHAALADQLASWLAQVPTGELRDRGIALGKAAAAAVARAARRRRLGFPGHVRIQGGTGSLPDDSTLERLRRPAGIPVRETVRARVPASIPAIAPAAAADEGLRAGAPRSPGVRRRREHASDDRPDRLCGLVDGVRRRIRQSSRSSALHRSADASLASGPHVRAHRRGAVRHVHRDMGREVTCTTIGVRIRPFALPVRTATRAPNRIATGSRFVPRRLFLSTARPTPRPAPPPSACSPKHSDAMCGSRWKRRRLRRACRHARSTALPRRQPSVPIHA